MKIKKNQKKSIKLSTEIPILPKIVANILCMIVEMTSNRKYCAFTKFPVKESLTNFASNTKQV